MPLSAPRTRREIHHRVIDMKAYAREDGLYDAEARLVDTKSSAFTLLGSPPVPAGQALHDIWVRITVDEEFVVRGIEAASEVTPWAICREAEATLGVLVGERLARGWSGKVKERLRGSGSCTHLMEMLIPLATTALQGVRGMHPERFASLEGDDAPIKVDSCYAYGRDREVVRRLLPLPSPPTQARAPERTEIDQTKRNE